VNHHKEYLWLETRELQARWKQPWQGLINFLLVTAFFLVVWWVFMDPRGIMRWYTPQYGYMYIRWILIVAIWQAYIFNFWPFGFNFMEKKHPLVKGLILIGTNVAIVGMLVWIFYYNILGRLAIPYFSAPVLAQLGMTEFFAREYSSLAILMMAAIASWLSPIWTVCFDNYPWHEMKQPARGFTVWAWTFLMTTYIFLFLMHPHYNVLFYPWQKFAAAYPWWYEFARTLSGNFNVGWVMCGTISIWLLEVTFERYPFRLIKTQPLRGIAGFFGVLFFALVMFNTFNFLQDVAWGRAVEGAKRLYAPDWRYLHSGELACMLLIPAMVLNFYFDNWPRKYSPSVNIAIRSLIILVSTGIIHYLYYKYSPPILGTQPGYSHPQQFPMAPVILWINMMLYHNWFMDLYPGKILVGREEVLLNPNIVGQKV
jgi:AAT family amino acid transporter